VSALVTLEHDGAATSYLLVAEPGGLSMEVRGERYATLATTSPLVVRCLVNEKVMRCPRDRRRTSTRSSACSESSCMELL